jgi:hypothetical protein
MHPLASRAHAMSASPSLPTVRGAGERRIPLHAVCTRSAQRIRLGAPGCPELRQALERPPMPAHARRGHPIKVDAPTGQEPGRATRWSLVRHVRIPAARVDQFVQLPGLIGPRPCAERLRDRGTRPRGQGLGGLLPRPRGGVLRGGGGIVRAYGHPVPAPPGGFPLDTGRREAWTPHQLTPFSLICYVMGRYWTWPDDTGHMREVTPLVRISPIKVLMRKRTLE